jgi:predicted dehydrogenase
MDTVRIGTLGAAKITPYALTKPATKVPEAEVVAVAARDRARAEKFAAKRGIPRVHDSYDALLADPEIDAVYNPLPNGLHREWTIKALEAGKHVLCEKPFTSNAAEAEEVAAAADRTGLVVMEAFHYRYHPVAARMKEIVASGELGEVRHVETFMCIPLPKPGDIRYRLDLAGGATMDVGSYAIHMNRLLAGAEPEVTSAQAKLSSPDVDRWMTASFLYPTGATGQMTCSMFSRQLLKIQLKVTGSEGELRVFNPTGPQLYHRITVKKPGGATKERIPGRDSTYLFQLKAFTKAVLEGVPTLTPPSDSVANMKVIDAVYRAAGLPMRGALRDA